jgi:hypothetical protein
MSIKIDKSRPSPRTQSRNGQSADQIDFHIPGVGTSAQFKGDPAVSAINTICAAQGSSSYHFVINRAGNITQHVPISLAAWASGTNNEGGNIDNRHSTLRHVRERRTNNNWFSVSVCWGICNDEIPNSAMIAAGNQLVAWINQQLNDSIRFIVGHDSITPITRSGCPGKQFPWKNITLRGVPARNNDTDLKSLAKPAQSAPQSAPAAQPIDAAMEILKQLAGMKNSAPSGSTINDAMQILKAIAGISPNSKPKVNFEAEVQRIRGQILHGSSVEIEVQRVIGAVIWGNDPHRKSRLIDWGNHIGYPGGGSAFRARVQAEFD